MKIIRFSIVLLFTLPFIIYACKPITAYPLKKGKVEFDWTPSSALTAKVIVLDRYPNEPPIYCQTKIFRRDSDTVTVSTIEFEYRGNCTIEPYENPESYQYSSIKYTVNISQGAIQSAQLWDVNNTIQ